MHLSPILALLLAVSTTDGPAVTPAANADPIAAAEELNRLRSELPRPASYARLLNSSDLSNAMNYPKQALVNEEEGRVTTWLLVGRDGKVKRCGVTLSSGSQALDTGTCSLLIATARFEPAKDESGTAIRSIFHQSMTWELEDELDPALIADAEELKRLESDFPKAARKAKLLNGTEVASAMDYPRKALVRQQTGTTVMLLLVGPDGRVERCAVTTSSGSATLDNQTCALFIANAKFEPARDRRGRSVRSLFRQRLTWRMQEGPALKDSVSRMRIVVGPENEVRSCKPEVLAEGEWIELPIQFCEEFLRGGTGALAFAREKSKLHDALVVVETWWVTSAERAIPDIGRRPGEVLVVLRSATASYDADGRRTHCEAGESYGLPEFMENVCAPDSTGGLPIQLPSATEAIENVRMVSALYLKDEPD